MASSYPGGLDSFTTKEDKVDLNQASHINDLQNAIVAAQTELGINPAGTRTDLLTRLSILMATNGALAQGTSFPSSPSPVEGQPFYKTDENTLYIHDGSSWLALSSHGVETYLSDDTFTVPGGITKVFITMSGGGGGGGGGTNTTGSGGGGGGAGFITFKPYTVTPTADLTVTVGAAGTGGASDTDGVDGGDSEFDNLTVEGGNKGLKGSVRTGGTGGNAGVSIDGVNGGAGTGGTAGSMISEGGSGGDGFANTSAYAGGGGSSLRSGGAGGIYNGGANAGTDAAIGGGGGGGGASRSGASAAGGDGGGGIVIVVY